MRVVDLAITPLKIIEIFIIKSFYRHACHCRINDVVKTASIRLALPHPKIKGLSKRAHGKYQENRRPQQRMG